MKKNLLAVAMAAATALGTIQVADACSYSTFEVDGNAYVARTMEAPDFMDEQLVTVPRGHAINGKAGTIGFVGMRHGDTEWISSGMNEYGLNAESLALLESEYVEEGEGDVNYLEVVALVLANAKNVDEAVKILKNTKVESTKVAVAHDLIIGMHYAIRDNDRAIVVEYVDGSGYPEIYENEVGVMTNDPSYPVQLEQAAPVIEATVSRTDEEIDTFAKYDSGSDGRFMHLAAQNAAYKLKGKAGDMRDDGLARAFSVLNSMEIVPSTMYWLWVSDAPQMIGYGNVADIANRDYYFRTADNPQIRKVDLDKIDFETVEYSAQAIYGVKQDFAEITPAK